MGEQDRDWGAYKCRKLVDTSEGAVYFLLGE